MSKNRSPWRIFIWVFIAASSLLLFPALSRCQTCVTNSQVTLTGNLRAANGIQSSNYVMTMAPSQQGYIAGCGVNLPTTFACATSTDGSVVGVPNPLTATINTTSGSGSLPAGVYYTVYEFYDAAGNVTLPGPETRTTLSVTESLVVNPPTSGIPSNAVGMDVFIGTSSGGETLQGQTIGGASFVQATSLVSGASPSSTNTTLCKITANDAVWPVGTGYNVSLVNSQGNPVPGYPMQWQLLGPGTTYNLANGLPYYHGVVLYPVPILAQPANHGTQSISGSLNMGGYNLLNVGMVGIGTATPGWPLDVENGLANFEYGFLLGGTAPTGTECAGSTDGIAIDIYLPCVTTFPTVYYQTVQDSGGSKPQESKLKLLAGSNAGMSCADDPGNGSTDCTVTNTAVVGPNTNVPTITCTGCTPFAGFNDGAGIVSTITSDNNFTVTFGGTYPHAMACTATSGTNAGLATETSYAVTQEAVTSNVASFTGSFTGLTAGTTLDLEGFPTATFFNGHTVTVLSSGLSSSGFSANFVHADTGTINDAAFALPNNPYSVYVTVAGSISGPATIHYLCHQ